MSLTPSVITLPATFVAITFALLLQPSSTGSHHGSTQRHLQKRLEEVFHRFSPLVTSHATLKHGDNCISPYEEKLRQQIAEELHLIATSHATVGRVKDAIKKMEEFMSMNDKELCNYKHSLVCDQDLRKCVCGPFRANVTYVWEDQECRFSEGSMCAAKSKAECAQGARCISLTTLEPCTSGLCFCQREYYPTTTTPAPTTSAPFLDGYPDSVQVSSGGDGEISREGRFQLHTPTPESFSSSSEEEDEDDDDGDEEKERIIIVQVSDVEKTPDREVTTRQPAISINNQGEVDLPEEVVDGTTVPSPIATSPIPTRRQELTTTIRRLERDIESIKNLDFGDECASLGEESNYADYRRLVNDMDCVTTENDEGILREIITKLETILELGNNMCNWTQHLQCSTQSKKCQCRTSSEDLDGYYLLFMEEHRQCVLVENSRCLSTEYLISRKAPVINIPCASEARCIAEETKAECKSKIENCFCRKIPRPTEASKQKKSKPKKTSTGSPSYHCTYLNLPLFLVNLLIVRVIMPQMISKG